MYNKRDKNNTVYHSYNVEVVANTIKSVTLENISQSYSVTNELKFDVSNQTQKYLLYMQFVAWNCISCPIASLTDYTNDPIFQQLPDKDTYFSDSDKRIYLDLWESKGYTNKFEKLRRDDSDLVLTVELKNVLQKKMHLRVWGYSQGEYLYLLSDRSLAMIH